MSTRLLKPGDTIADRYIVEDFIAEGGMQEVYKAKDKAFNRLVALKAPKNPSAKKRFDRSAQASAKVTHPNVARTLDFITTDPNFYLVEELIEGSDLQKRFDSEFDYFDPHLAGHVVHHLAKGLAACHHVDVFHRDLKPSNVMVASDPSFSTIKLTDFGIAKMAAEEINEALEGQKEETITSSQTAVGAIPYMAPELFENPKEAGKPADVWSLGAMLFYLLSGEKPFGTGFKAIMRILKAEKPDKKQIFKVDSPQFKDLLEDLWTIIEKCLKKEPVARPSADELVEKFSKVCYSTAHRRIGTIYNFGKFGPHWGFIKSGGFADAFFHKQSFYGKGPIGGMRVSFAPFEGKPRERAFPVLPLKNI
jgi:serine/threonine protein kinase